MAKKKAGPVDTQTTPMEMQVTASEVPVITRTTPVEMQVTTSEVPVVTQQAAVNRGFGLAKNPCVYTIKCIANGKVYLSETFDRELRKADHYRRLENNKHHNVDLQHDFNTHGADKIHFETLFEGPLWKKRKVRRAKVAEILAGVDKALVYNPVSQVTGAERQKIFIVGNVLLLRKPAIYCIKNLSNGMLYFGETKSLAQRYTTHNSFLGLNKHNNVWLQEDYNTYAVSEFSFTVIAQGDEWADEATRKAKELELTNANPGFVYSTGREIFGSDNPNYIDGRSVYTSPPLPPSRRALRGISIDGTIYESCADAARKRKNCSIEFIYQRVNNDNFPSWRYI